MLGLYEIDGSIFQLPVLYGIWLIFGLQSTYQSSQQILQSMDFKTFTQKWRLKVFWRKLTEKTQLDIYMKVHVKSEIPFP